MKENSDLITVFTHHIRDINERLNIGDGANPLFAEAELNLLSTQALSYKSSILGNKADESLQRKGMICG